MPTQWFENTIAGMKAFKAWLKSQAVTYDENSLLVIEKEPVKKKDVNRK